MFRRVSLAAVAIVALPACPDCEGTTSAQATLLPAVLDMGPIAEGTTCQAVFQVGNTGAVDLRVNSADLLETEGDWTVLKVPGAVRLGGSEDLILTYTAGTGAGVREGTRLQVTTNDPDNDGIVSATASAFVAEGPVPLAKTSCGPQEAPTSPCEGLSFGAVPVGNPVDPIDIRPGRNLQVQIINDGNADLVIDAASTDIDNPDFAMVSVLRGNQVFPLEPNGVTVPAGRTGECGELLQVDNVAVISVRYAPTGIGSDEATLTIHTNGAEGADIEIPLLGQGADVGLTVDPEIVRFNGASEITVHIANQGTDAASVNETCVDLDGNDVCDPTDAACTGAAGDTVLDGALSCRVRRMDESNEGKGFVLDPIDGDVGRGDDERNVIVSYAPGAGIPAGTTLIFRTNILANKVYRAALTSEPIGILAVSSDDACGDSFCLQSESATPEDRATWSGTLSLTLENVGDDTLTIVAIAFDPLTQPATLADFVVQNPLESVLAPGISTTISISYENHDGSLVDPADLIITHDGALGTRVAPVIVVAPR